MVAELAQATEALIKQKSQLNSQLFLSIFLYLNLI